MATAIKLRQGFGGCRDSLTALIEQLGKMTRLRLLPPDLLDGSAKNALGSPG
jgi:hypothetical protein